MAADDDWPASQARRRRPGDQTPRLRSSPGGPPPGADSDRTVEDATPGAPAPGWTQPDPAPVPVGQPAVPNPTTGPYPTTTPADGPHPGPTSSRRDSSGTGPPGMTGWQLGLVGALAVIVLLLAVVVILVARRPSAADAGAPTTGPVTITAAPFRSTTTTAVPTTSTTSAPAARTPGPPASVVGVPTTTVAPTTSAPATTSTSTTAATEPATSTTGPAASGAGSPPSPGTWTAVLGSFNDPPGCEKERTALASAAPSAVCLAAGTYASFRPQYTVLAAGSFGSGEQALAFCASIGRKTAAQCFGAPVSQNSADQQNRALP